MGAQSALADALWPLLVELWEQGYDIGQEAAQALAGAFETLGAGGQIAAEGYTWLNQIVGTLLDKLAGILADYDGDNADDLAGELHDAMADASAAEMIAQTEVARASSAAATDVYRAAGIYEVMWVTEDASACPECLANEASGPHVYGNPFPSGDIAPPAHPRCRCALLPIRR
jgi:SPP1 gp7 family putative phage head morphogenesis protein